MQSSRPPEAQRVLVVDDNAPLAENVAEIFAEAGFICGCAGDGKAARANARERSPDLAIVDVRLPGESGVALAADLKRLHQDCEVILMTANASLDTAVAAIREDVFAYVQKPFDPDELLALGQRALDQVALRREGKRLEGELARSESLYRGVVDSVEAFIVGFDRDGRIAMWNRSARSSTGHELSALRHRRFADLLPSEASKNRLQEALGRVDQGLVVEDLELPLCCSDGGTRIVRWRLSALTGAETDGPLVLAVGSDITERLDLERRAAEAEAMASLSTLTAGLAHEIRNPLNAASLQLKLLSRGSAKVQDRELAAQLERRTTIVGEELSRLTNLLDDFLNLAKPRRLELQSVDTAALMAEVIELQRPAAEQAGVELYLDSGQRAAPGVLGDADLLKQVLVNLVVNAIEALSSSSSRAGGRIALRCEATSEARAELSVEDDGPGIPAEVSDSLFVPFVTSKQAGTGLGLTIVKRIIDRHGGSIHIASDGDEGTRVRINLARSPA
ncbi:MAG: response regulator [Myxococcales bacterium]|nr:response regulator [Myxococcales bacterium]